MKKLELNVNRIRQLMRGRQPDVAAAMGISVSSLSRKINQSQPMTLEEVNRLAEILETDPLSLLCQTVE